VFVAMCILFIYSSHLEIQFALMHMYWKRFVWRSHSNRLWKQVIKKDPTQKKSSFTNRASRIETAPETEGHNERLVLMNLTASWKTHHFNIYSLLFCFFKHSRWSYEASSWWNVSRGSWSVCGPGWGWCSQFTHGSQYKFTYTIKSHIYVIEQIYVSFLLKLYTQQRNVAVMCRLANLSSSLYTSQISSDAHVINAIYSINVL